LKIKKVLGTGVLGYIGQHCAVELLKNRYAVRGSVRSLSKTAMLYLKTGGVTAY